MNAKLAALLFIAILILPGISPAVTSDNFQARTTQDLVNLCENPSTDPLHNEAVNFCEGYIVGAYSFHNAQHPESGAGRMVCLPQPAPSRDAATGMFVEWAKAHPQYMSEKPVDTLFRFAETTWPCKG